MTKRTLLTTFAVALMLLFTGSLSALADDPADELKKLLIDLKGYKAEKAEGASIDMGGMKVTTALRSYSAEDKELTVSVIVGTNMLTQGYLPEMQAETSEGKIVTETINGFKVVQGYNKEDNEGYIMINLVEKENEGALFVFGYAGIDNKKGLELAKQFDWKKLKTTTAKMLE